MKDKKDENPLHNFQTLHSAL